MKIARSIERVAFRFCEEAATLLRLWTYVVDPAVSGFARNAEAGITILADGERRRIRDVAELSFTAKDAQRLAAMLKDADADTGRRIIREFVGEDQWARLTEEAGQTRASNQRVARWAGDALARASVVVLHHLLEDYYGRLLECLGVGIGSDSTPGRLAKALGVDHLKQLQLPGQHNVEVIRLTANDVKHHQGRARDVRKAIPEFPEGDLIGIAMSDLALLTKDAQLYALGLAVAVIERFGHDSVLDPVSDVGRFHEVSPLWRHCLTEDP